MRGYFGSTSRGGRTGGEISKIAAAARARWARRVAGVVLTALAGRLYYMQVIEHDRYFDLAKDNILREEVLPAIRGVIRDREGQVLVDSEPACVLTIDPFDRTLRKPGVLSATLARLAPAVGAEESVMADIVKRERDRSYLPVVLVRQLDQSVVAYVEEHRERFPGVAIAAEPRRRYPHGKLAAHLLGYVGEITEEEIAGSQAAAEQARINEPAPRIYRLGDVVGREGIERDFESRLGGMNGVRLVEVNALGRRAAEGLAPITRFAEVRPPLAGEDLILTLDLELQQAAEIAFPDSLTGAVVVLDARDGGLLAAVSRPSYDPNEFATGFSSAAWKRLNTDPRHPFQNRYLRSAYPPGSVFKVVTGAAALAEHRVGAWQYLEGCSGGYQFGSRWFGCHHVHGGMTFADAMMVSCDTYFYQLGLRVGIDDLADYAHRFGCGKASGIGLREGRGLIPDNAWYDRNYGEGRWGRGVVLNLSIGQGEILMTPLQLAVMMGAVGTGQVVSPHVVLRANGADVPPKPPVPLAIPEDVRRQLVQALTKVVEDTRGTGKRAKVPGIKVAGKTGTAQNPHGKDHAVFAAFAPASNPEVAIAVVVETIGHGGEFAAPIAGQILQKYFGVEPAAPVTGPDAVVAD